MAALRFGPWVVQRVLGRGGMGELYAARHEQTGQDAAVKVMRAELVDGEAVQRFEREVRALVAVRHPGVVAPLDAGRGPDGRPWLAMEHVQGESLHALVQRGGPMAPAEAGRLIERVARALDQVHAQGIVHRDIKPENILVGADGAPRIVDFGLARFLLREGSLTASSELLGTPAYMAPEQADGRARQAGPAADVYSLGATLFFVLTGRAPFLGVNAIAVFEQLLTACAPTPSSLVSGVPRALEAVVMRCLEKDAAARYPTAGALADALNLVDRPVRGGARGHRRALGPALGVAAGALAAGAALFVALQPGPGPDGSRVTTTGSSSPATPTPSSTPTPAPATPPEAPERTLPPGAEPTTEVAGEAPIGSREVEPPSPPPPPPAVARERERERERERDGARLEAQGDLLRALEAWRSDALADARDEEAWVAVARLVRRTERPGAAWLAPALERFVQRGATSVDLLVELAWALVRVRKPGRALEVVEAALRRDPRSADALHVAALAHLDLGDVPAAMQRLERAVAAAPGHVSAQVLLATLTAARDPQESLRRFEASVPLAPDDPQLWVHRAVVLTRLGRPREALADLDRAVEREYGVMALERRCSLRAALERLDEARADAQRRLERDVWSPGGFLARAAAQGPAYALAMADLERELATPVADHSSDRVRRVRAEAEHAVRRCEEQLAVRARQAGWPAVVDDLERAGARRAALWAWRQALGGQPPASAADAARHVELALLAGDVEEAEQVARAATARWRDDAGALAAAARAARHGGRLKDATELAQAALALDPDHPRALLERGMADFAQAHAVRGDWLADALVRDPGLHEARLFLALDRGRRAPAERAAALADLEALARDTTVASAPHFAAQLLMLERPVDWRRVLEAETRALLLDPRIGDAWYYRSLARMSLGDPDGAAADLSHMLELVLADQPEREPAIRLPRAMARFMQGDLDGALEDARKGAPGTGRWPELGQVLGQTLSRARRCAGLDDDLARGFAALGGR